MTEQRLEERLLKSALESLAREPSELLPLRVLVDRQYRAHSVPECLNRLSDRHACLGNGFSEAKAERRRPAAELLL